jgi:outer membrane lipoprotein-sorting protein
MNRKNIKLILIFFFCSIVLPGYPEALETDSYLIDKVRDSIDRIKPFKVAFTQQVFDEDQLEIEESGEIVFKDQKTLKWTYLDPDYKVFILMGDDYKFYDRDNEQLTIGKIKDKNRQWLWQLLFSKEMAGYIKPDNKNMKVYLKNEPDKLDIEIEIDNEFLPVKAIQKDPSGVIMVYHFKDYMKKIKITDQIFKLEVPEDTDVVTEY